MNAINRWSVVAALLIGSAVWGHTVNVSSLNVRSGPGTGYSVIWTLSKGTVVNVVSTSGSWSKINSPKTGWVYSAYLTNTSHTTTSSSDLVWPVSGRVSATWYYSYGGFHGAVDIAGSSWDSVGAARGGRVQVASYGWNGGYGNYVRIYHGNGYTTDYHHFVRIATAYGRTVSRLQTIGYRGTTGQSSGNHTHFDLRRWGSKIHMTAYVGNYVTKGRAVPNNYSGL